VKNFLLSLMVALLGLGFVALDAQAKRLGGGGSSGLQRQMPARPTPTSPPAQQAPSATPSPAGTATPAAAPRRSWMGPIAGLAAGLGLAALASHLGMGQEFGNLLMIMLLAAVAVVAIRFVMRRFGPAAQDRGDPAGAQGLQYAGAGASAGAGWPAQAGAGPSAPGLAPAAAGLALPAGFDSAGFERIAKLIFIRMQAANDKADLEDLRQFATPEMFAVFRLDLQERKGSAQQTDVVQLDAQVLDFAQEDARQVVSVRFHGLIREERDASATPFDEVWHLVKPIDGSRDWAIAGIAQTA
jgi:predicted lipid-binding transport protein (Tim44 family)